MNPTTQDSLIGMVRHGNGTAWTAFITGHSSMVHDLAHDLARNDDQYPELVGEGEVALCEAATEFVVGNFRCQFTTFAYPRVRRAMISYQRTEDGMSSEWRARSVVRTRREMDHLRSLLEPLGWEQEPTPDDLAFVSSVFEPSEVDVQRCACRLEGTARTVDLDSVTACAQSTDECYDLAFAEQLVGATRQVWCGMLNQISLTGNVSMELEARRLHCSRGEVKRRLVVAIKEWATVHYGGACDA